MPQKNIHRHSKHIDKKLRNRLKIYFFISLVLIGIIIRDLIFGIVSFPFMLIGLIFGLVIGVISARMFHISWSHDAKKIVSQLDVFGSLILILYILFEFFRDKIISYFIYGPAVGGVSISLVTGMMIGRTLGTRGKIIQVLKEQKILK